MLDKEQVIKGLEQFKSDFKPFCGNGADWKRVDDAIELLKEQEPVKPNGTRKAMSFAFNGMLTGYCPRCGTIVNSVGNSGACGKCGQKFDWE